MFLFIAGLLGAAVSSLAKQQQAQEQLEVISEDPVASKAIARSELEAIYKKHKPSKLKDIDELLMRWQGKYALLVSMARQKYVTSAESVDCVPSTSFGDWRACSASCGAGKQTRTRAVMAAAQFGGAACTGMTETRSCNLGPCPGHYEAGTHAFDPCSNVYAIDSKGVRSQAELAARFSSSSELLIDDYKVSEGAAPHKCRHETCRGAYSCYKANTNRSIARRPGTRGGWLSRSLNHRKRWWFGSESAASRPLRPFHIYVMTCTFARQGRKPG